MNPHRVGIFDWSAPNGVEFIDWEPTGVPDSAGVHDVVRLLTQFRDFVRAKREELGRAVTTLAAINNPNVSSLIQMAYRASFQTDEGRSIRAKIAVPREANWCAGGTKLGEEEPAAATQSMLFTALAGFAEIGTVVEDARLHTYRFREPLLLADYKPLVKLAPLLSERDGVITVQEVNGALCVTGMGLLDRDDGDGDLLHMPGLWQPSAGLMVEIIDPGHLRVVEGEASFELFADRLVTHWRLYQVPLAQKWLAELSRGWVKAFQSDGDYSPNAFLFRTVREGADIDDEHPELDVQVAVARILRSAVSLGHGGAFAVLPDVSAAPLRIKYLVQPVDLGEELFQTWRAHCKVWTVGRDANADHLGAAEGKRVAANRWLSRLASVGQLSAADGCVVFDRRLVLHGFGGSIETDLTGLKSVDCHDLTSGRDVPAGELLKSFGERHKSAFALCRRVPNAIVFVASQDGDLRVFASDADSRVFFASGLRV